MAPQNPDPSARTSRPCTPLLLLTFAQRNNNRYVWAPLSVNRRGQRGGAVAVDGMTCVQAAQKSNAPFCGRRSGATRRTKFLGLSGLLTVLFASQLVAIQPVLAQSSASDHDASITVSATNHSSGTAGTSRSPASHGVGPVGTWCSYVPQSAAKYDAMASAPGVGKWYSVSCWDGNTYLGGGAIIWLAGTGSRSPAEAPVSAKSLAEEAESSITLPAPVINTNPDESSFVNLPTWLWIDPSAWHAIHATAKAGDVSAIATAVPVEVVFSTGDGATVTCNGPGMPYDYSKPASMQSTYCSHVYSLSSADQQSPDGNPDDAAFPVSATITWDVTWESRGAPGGGALPSLATTGESRLRVQQVESLQNP
jgi:hypothetical protein